MNIFLLYIFLIKIVIICSDNQQEQLKLNYYKKLISTLSSKAKTTPLPTSNAEFQTGYQSSQIEDFGEFDFIIVGAGSSGTVVATRLSEITKWKILLLEAGGEETDFSDIPGEALDLQFIGMNWGYLTVPQNGSCLGMKNRQCSVARGKVLGGTSAINVMMYVRGSPEDYDKWEKMGNKGWSYKDVLPYFIKSENSQIDGDEGYHGKGGLLNVEFEQPLQPMVDRFCQANSIMNVPRLDYNGKKQIGCSPTQFNTKLGKRHSTQRAFLSSARSRNNLKVVTKALATKILINKHKKEAEGIIFVKNNKKYKAIAKKEVIVSGGPINSPQLLMLSGIGPKKHLEEFGIDVIADLPVGEKLMEHPVFHALKFITSAKGDNPDMETIIKEYIHGYGPLTISTNIQAISFMPSKNPFAKKPEIEFMFYPFNITNEFYNMVFNFNEEISEKYLNQLDQLRSIQILPILLHPRSRGSVTLQSNSPIDFPLVTFNMFTDENNEDIKNYMDAIKFVMNLIKTKPFKEVNATFIDNIPVCQDKKKFSDNYWECLLRHMTTTIYHPSGTTKMGRKNDPDSVVDNNLKVHGIEKLRIVDSGIFPTTISGHLNAPSIMIGEKISDVIKDNYRH